MQNMFVTVDLHILLQSNFALTIPIFRIATNEHAHRRQINVEATAVIAVQYQHVGQIKQMISLYHQQHYRQVIKKVNITRVHLE